MSREEIQKLLGGYATGTLTAEEQQVLFEAALDDQELFDALAREQVIRDLLRDPAAKARVLAELDSGAGRGWKAWVRRPLWAGLAMAGVAAIAVVVWQGGRKPVEKSVLVAENHSAIGSTTPAPGETAPPPPAHARVEAPQGVKPAAVSPRQRAIEQDATREPVGRDVPAAAPLRMKPAATSASLLRDKDISKEQLEIKAQAPVFAETKSLDQSQQVQSAQAPAPSQQAAQNQTMGTAVAVLGTQTQDARALFYESQTPPSGRMAFAPPQEERAAKGEGGGGGGQARPAKKAAIPGAAGVFALGGYAPEALRAPLYPGIRCSIVRGGKEADPSTPLSAGEAVTLKLIPNADGFLYVMEGDKVLASGPVRRLVPFETPEVKSDAPGQRQYRILLTRVPQATDALAGKDAASPANLVKTKGEREAATYAVQTGNAPAAQQVVVPITLSWR